MYVFVISAPTVAPENIKVSVQNGTVAEVRWDAVPLSTVRGRLKGYKVLAEHWKYIYNKYSKTVAVIYLNMLQTVSKVSYIL